VVPSEEIVIELPPEESTAAATPEVASDPEIVTVGAEVYHPPAPTVPETEKLTAGPVVSTCQSALALRDTPFAVTVQLFVPVPSGSGVVPVPEEAGSAQVTEMGSPSGSLAVTSACAPPEHQPLAPGEAHSIETLIAGGLSVTIQVQSVRKQHPRQGLPS
jgi:hypothetical protein